jgi:hypothetical protein
MSNQSNQLLADAFAELSTPLVADACLRLGVPLRLARRTQDPSYTFRQHLQAIGGAIEE